MPALAAREFECILCGRQFTRVTQDLILPWTLICDECMKELLEVEGEALPGYLAAARRAADPVQAGGSTASSAPPHPWEKEIIAHVRRVKRYRSDGPGGDLP